MTIISNATQLAGLCKRSEKCSTQFPLSTAMSTTEKLSVPVDLRSPKHEAASTFPPLHYLVLFESFHFLNSDRHQRTGAAVSQHFFVRSVRQLPANICLCTHIHLKKTELTH